MLHDDFEAWIRARAIGCMEQDEIDELCKADLDLASHEYTFRDDSVQAQWEAWQAALRNYAELAGAAKQAFGALVGATASDDSVQGRARIRLREALKSLNIL